MTEDKDDEWGKFRKRWEDWTDSITKDRANEESSWIRFRGYWKQFFTEWSLYMFIAIILGALAALVSVPVTEYVVTEWEVSPIQVFISVVTGALVVFRSLTWDKWLRQNTS